VVVLALFALLAGAGTALSPCVLPVLPAVLSAGVTGGRRRPLGVVTGLSVTFTITIVGVATVTDSVGLGTGLTRDLAIAALAVFGVVTLVPAIGDRLAARLSPLARYGPRRLGDGFGSGLLAGAALGFVYAPCAGPILAAVIAVGAASGRSIVVGAAFSLGSAIVLFALALGGRALLDRFRRAGGAVRVHRAVGVIMLATAIAMVFQLDVRFQSAIADHLPAGLVNPTRSLETSHAVRDRLSRLRPRSRFAKAASAAHGQAGLPVLGKAPDFTGNQRWFNTSGGRPLALAGLRGRVVLIDFWTYTCINCLRTLPYLEAWDAKYRRAGLTIVGVHSPEFGFEKNADNVQDAIEREGIRYPVAQDNDLATWNAWGNEYWPAEYLVDAEGRVRSAEAGEGRYEEKERAIRAVLAERGARLGGRARPRGVVVPGSGTTPETYLGAARAKGFLIPPSPGTHDYESGTPTQDQFALEGKWKITDESATAVSEARLNAVVRARRVYLVLSSTGGGGSVDVSLDGRSSRVVKVHGQRLYELVDLPREGSHKLSLRFDPGVSGFAFTFG
jgi:cytochrome c biogenesis protein CcdA/thiol-disulfide isomerase/thioredoxin